MGDIMKKFCILSFIFILVDRIIKLLVQNYINGELYIIKNFFYLTYTKNSGAAFSILEGKQFLLIIIGVLASSFILMYMKKKNNYSIGYIMLFSGIIGNVIDRLLYNYVIDYLGFIIIKNNMPIFNFADSLIVIGAIILIIFSNDRGEDKNENYL